MGQKYSAVPCAFFYELNQTGHFEGCEPAYLRACSQHPYLFNHGIHKHCHIFCLFQGLKQQRDKLNQHKKRIELNLDKERQVAKELLKQNKKE